MSRGPRRPRQIPEPPDGFFYLTQWRRARDTEAAAVRDRWKGSLAVLGIRTVLVVSGDFVALAREGEEALSESGLRERLAKQGQKAQVKSVAARG